MVFIIVILLVSEAKIFSFCSLAYCNTNTFGFTGAWDSSVSTFGGLYASNFTGPSDLGNITKISVFIATGGTYAQTVIYSDKNGKPGILLAKSDSMFLSGRSGTWTDFAVNYRATPDTTYWLSILFNGSGTYYCATEKEGVSIFGLNQTMDSHLPESFPNATVYSGSELRIYASYSPLEPPSGDSWSPFSRGYFLWIIIIGIIFAAFLAIMIANSRGKRAKARSSK